VEPPSPSKKPEELKTNKKKGIFKNNFTKSLNATNKTTKKLQKKRSY
jgi:hypothetical protein